MSSLQRKKSFYLILGLMVLFALGLLGQAGMLSKDSGGSNGERAKPRDVRPGAVVFTRKFPVSPSGGADAAEEKPAASFRRRLPSSSPPAPASEPASVPLLSAGVPIGGGQASRQELQSPPPVTAALATPEHVKDMPEVPMKAEPLEAHPSAAAAPPVSADEPGRGRAAAQTAENGSGVYPFSLLLCSHRSQKNAVAMQPEFERKGLSPYIVHTDLGEKGKWWRTLLGHYESYAEAAQAMKHLQIENVVAVKTPFANLIGYYPSEKEAAGAAARCCEKGLFPYVAKGAGNAARLLIGAFPTQAGAEQQRRELEDMGIAAHPIER